MLGSAIRVSVPSTPSSPAGEAWRAPRARHACVVAFLIALGVSGEVAESDAEGLEHHVSDETLAVTRRFPDARP